MVKFAFAIGGFVINTVINEPVLFGLRIDIDTVNDADAFNNAMGVATEPYRVCRRVNILRDYPDDKIKIYPWNQRKSGSIIDWIWKRLSIELGCDHRYCSLSSILRKGCTPETLRVWYQKYLDKQNPVKVQQLSDQERIKQLERENKELQRANEILRKAAAFFAQAELDRPHK